jgi:protein-tyrosine-phosphatase
MILFICRGNICRSPMAMALCRHIAGERGVAIEAVSAGYYDWNSFPHGAQDFARRAVEELCGSDLLEAHTAARWNQGMVQSARLVVVAEEWMKGDFPRDKTLTMRELAGRTGDIDDPYGGEYPVYVDCAIEMRDLLLEGWELLTCTQEYRP